MGHSTALRTATVYTAVLNAVERTIHLNGASQRSAVNNFEDLTKIILNM